jgi:glutathione S-transferase
MKEVATFHLEIDRFLRAPREKVFAAFVEESLLKAWLCPRGMIVAEANADARVGGGYRIVMAGRDGSRHAVLGVYQAIERPEFIAYTWRAEGGPASGVTTLVEVRFAEKDGGTLLHMRHTGFPNAEARDSHRGGWASCFNRLSDLVDPEGSAGTVTLFGDPRSSYCWTARLGLAEKGVKYRLTPNTPQTPEQRAVHPLGLVPALRDGENEIYETRAILHYVDEAFEGPSLIPKGGVTARARNEQWISVINCHAYDAMVRRYLFQHMAESGGPPLVVELAARSRGGLPVRDVVETARRETDGLLGIFDRAYGANDYLTGSTPAMADLFLAPIIHYFSHLPGSEEMLRKYPRVRQGHEAMKARPSFAATLPTTS